MDSITLSGNEFKALASETRTSIIKHLQQRNHTLSELSKKTNLSAPTVKQHLEILEKAGLVQQMDNGRKWKYYSLTRKGENITSSEEPKNILIVLAANFIVLASATYFFFAWLAGQEGIAISRQFSDAAKNLTETGTNIASSGASPATTASAPQIQGTIVATQPLPISFETTIVLVAAIIVLSVLFGFLIARAIKKK